LFFIIEIIFLNVLKSIFQSFNPNIFNYVQFFHNFKKLSIQFYLKILSPINNDFKFLLNDAN